jgi:hypothetical protein
LEICINRILHVLCDRLFLVDSNLRSSLRFSLRKKTVAHTDTEERGETRSAITWPSFVLLR